MAKLFRGGTILGKDNVVKKLKKAAIKVIQNSITDTIIVWHVRYPELANQLKEIMESKNTDNKTVIIQEAGPVVGTHVGEKSIGYMYIGSYDKR